MSIQLSENLLQELTRLGRQFNLDRIILFGSRARGTGTERSDVDIAVTGGDIDGFYWEVKENFPSLLLFDIVDLDAGITPALQQELEKDGVTIYEKAG
ncbi:MULTISPECIES: nucleotidyltransferase family protein [Acidaminococcus]|uniref:nucleotidyltransferase family protein n=1 Tax=Acidaminococcus TaxID=904 RepID=UPI002666BC83|nr:nucleotidyltransferase domain-containing protein [Acidaminococcus sp.]MDO5596905.1 nucleotidyltransferase domain-containing protein [Acidaminococcus sp.]